ncbi:MAG: ABC transporter permease [Chloroflexi bacterium]|nr:ABC transporter permease [Chloroflexota bacterium]
MTTWATAAANARAGAIRVPWSARLPYPARDALRRWRGLVGMMIGVGIALGIGMAIIGITSASLDLYTADYRQSAADLYVITEGGKLIAALPSDVPGNIKHARAILSQIRAISGVQAAVGTITGSLERGREGPRRADVPAELIAAVGVDGDPGAIPGALLLHEGRWPRRSDEVMLGSKLSREKQLRVGDSIRLSGRDFAVSGVGRLRGIGFSSDSMAYMDLDTFRQRAEVSDQVNLVLIETDRPSSVRTRVQEMGTFSVWDPNELAQQAYELNASSIIMNYVLIALTLAIAGLFVSNMLLRAVAERRIEFATLRAIGVPRRTVLLTIAAQAILVSVAAGLIGIGISTILGTLINVTIAAQFGFESLYNADPTLFAAVFLLALGLGLISGVYPAREAMRVDPALVLREA